MSFLYAEQNELVCLLKDSSMKPGQDYMVIDVRSDDFAGGHIPGAKNIPSHQFLENLPLQVAQLKHIPKLYFHCALSQVRGPKCATRYMDALTACGEGSMQSVKVLRGGFGAWQENHKNDSDLTVDYDEKVWQLF